MPVLFFVSLLRALSAQGAGGPAEQYVLWAEQAMAEGRWGQALSGLERAADYGDLSSDISYLLALARARTDKPRGAVLEALGRALEAPRWSRYSPDQALLLEAETLITLRHFSGALAVLAQIPGNADSAALRLFALKGLGDLNEFRRAMGEALEQYPRDPRPAVIFCEYARGKIPGGNEQALMDLVLGRLPYLLEAEPRLAFLAAPFIPDRAESRRLVAAYRGIHQPLPGSIPISLSLGLIDQERAVEELFNPPGTGTAEHTIDRDLILELFPLVQDQGPRRLFREKLLGFSGAITADADQDGYAESRARYREGVITEYTLDADQDGLAELLISFDAGGSPRWAEQAVLPEAGPGHFPFPVKDEDRTKALIFWETYPGVLRSELAGLTYIPSPGEFLFNPVRFTALGESEAGPGLPYPEAEPLGVRVSPRTLASFALSIGRPSGEFKGAVEWIDLRRGIPQRAVEILDGYPVSVTEFVQGRPRLQRLDLDLDHRMETVRHFRTQAGGGPEFDFFDENSQDYKKIIEFSESDWDGDGIFETGEEYLFDGTVVYSWDWDGDGVREYSETRTRIEEYGGGEN
jgi:tetratricopeptide (TPR) repeat protein